MSELGAPSSGSPGKRDEGEIAKPTRRGVYILPSLFTIGTLICGYIAILSTLRGAEILAAGMGMGAAHLAFDDAAIKLGWAIVFDGLDGRIARLTNSTSNFGKEFDSLADVITFGIAPAFLAYAWGVQAIPPAYRPEVVHDIQRAGWLVGFAFVICGAARLARFNIDRGSTSDRRFFVGLPIPAGAGVVAAIVHFVKYPIQTWAYSIVWLAIVAAAAFLMVSRVRYFSFKAIDLRKKHSYLLIIILGLVVWAIWAYSEPVLLFLAMVYFLHGPVMRLITRSRTHPPAETQEAAPGRQVSVT
ncbi:MAG: CDP-diacylglycerol--serine O-phosphatidyltransferase [Acidobacteriota bacterium]|nr:CDP-diacylglycerol--serine O-phosphatidyltransferase [Acidobacteriota bacterium]